jgi:hypothetical protein
MAFFEDFVRSATALVFAMRGPPEGIGKDSVNIF